MPLTEATRGRAATACGRMSTSLNTLYQTTAHLTQQLSGCGAHLAVQRMIACDESLSTMRCERRHLATTLGSSTTAPRGIRAPRWGVEGAGDLSRCDHKIAPQPPILERRHS